MQRLTHGKGLSLPKFFTKYLFHILFWVMVLNSFVFEFCWMYYINFGQFIHVIWIKMALLMAIAYTNILLLIPTLWKKKRYGVYFLAILGLAATATLVINRIDVFIWKVFRGPVTDYDAQTRLYIDFSTVLRYLLYSAILQITVEYYDQQKRLSDIQIEKLKAEFQALQSQVNPHFLFNTLNNLYGLILDGSERSADVVLRLSDLLKYMLSEGRQEKAPLKTDLEHLKNYIELEKIRLKYPEGISVEIPLVEDRYSITPLLLLPLAENAFKHGLNNKKGRLNWRLSIDMQGPLLCLQITNDKSGPAAASLGLGMDNVRRRLQLLYPARHDLRIVETSDTFELYLQLDLT